MTQDPVAPVGAAPDAATVHRWVEQDFAVRLRDLAPVEGGTDTAAAVWQATTTSGALLAVKWTGRQTRTGLRLAASLAAEGHEGVAALAPTTDGRAWSRRGGGRLSVAPWIAGEDAATVGIDLDQWEQYGALLARVHRHGFPMPERRQGARRGIRRRRRRYRANVAELDTRATAEGDVRAADDGGSSAVLQVWREARPRVDRLLAGTRLPITPTDDVVPCHGDPHLGNVVVDPGGRLRLIDWDEAVVGPREVDLHLVEFSVLFAPTSAEQLAAFRRGYGDVPLDEVRLVRFACVRALEDLVSTALGALDGPEDARAEELAVCRGILSPVGSASLVEPRLERLLTEHTADA